MDKKGLIFLLIIISLSFFISGAGNGTITGSTVTGEIITGDVAVALSINISVNAPPQLSILSPKNHTYFTSQNLNLNFTVTDNETISYSLDSAANITITGNIKFNTTEGSHSLFLYANNSNGLTIKNVTFFVDLTRFNVFYNEYSGSKKGSSINFNASSYEDAQNATGIILENLEYGKINFNDNIINLTDDSNFSDNQLDLDSNTNFSFDRIFVNSTAIGNFNKSAMLTLYNLTFTNPRILRDGSLCSSAICTEQSYSGGTFNFNVTSFSTYTTEETPSEAGDTGGQQGGGSSGGGASGGVVTTIDEKIKTNPEEITITLRQGTINTEQLLVINNQNKEVRVVVKEQKLSDFLIIDEQTFTLNARGSKTISLDFFAREDAIPNLYVGDIIILVDETEKKVPVFIEVESAEPLFDVRARIPLESRYILPGEILNINTEIFNLGTFGRIDTEVEYSIINKATGETIIKEHESVAIETQASVIKEFFIPNEVEYGEYILYVRVVYNGKVASSTAEFEVTKDKVSAREKIYIISILALIMVVFAFVYYEITYGKHRASPRKINMAYIIKRR